jgi:hypothetical protein
MVGFVLIVIMQSIPNTKTLERYKMAEKEYIERGVEMWKAIIGYEGLYEVSNFGRIRNVNGHIKQLSLKKDKHTDYKEVSLSKNGKNKRFLAHRLVASAFIPNPHNLPIINHKDENGTNNFVGNLEWCDKSYNARYRKFPKKNKQQSQNILSQEHKNKISESVKKYRREHTKLKFQYNGKMLSVPEIAEELGVSPKTLMQRYYRTGSVFLDNSGERKVQV